MTDYRKNTNFTAKDALPSGNPSKVIKGADFDSEFDEIATAISSKGNSHYSETDTTTSVSAASTTTISVTHGLGTDDVLVNITLTGATDDDWEVVTTTSNGYTQRFIGPEVSGSLSTATPAAAVASVVRVKFFNRSGTGQTFTYSITVTAA